MNACSEPNITSPRMDAKVMSLEVQPLAREPEPRSGLLEVRPEAQSLAVLVAAPQREQQVALPQE